MAESGIVVGRWPAPRGYVYVGTRISPLSVFHGFGTREEAEAIEGGARTPGEQICASYINFCWNGDHRVIIPGFGAPDADRRAKAIFEKALPGREVIQLQIGRALALGGGNMHCMTCHQPSA